MRNPRVLVVDDEPGIRESLCGVLEDENFVCRAVESGEQCMEELAHQNYEVVLLDVWLPGMDGMETLARIQEIPFADRPEVVIISGHGTIETAVKATKLGAFDFLEKPLTIEKVTVVLNNAIQQRRLELELSRLKESGEAAPRIIGESVPMKALRQQLSLMAATNGRVLIFGESGTGKELIAHAIHAASARSSESFVEVNCAAIPEELIESELFGHRKGSLAGALENKIGKLQKADGGTLFLDEVGDMSLKTQAKLLRALDEQRFEPVGAIEFIKVDVRVVASTNKNLEEEIERGNFREDLFYRLNVIPFHVPPLREHVEDVRLLAGHFLKGIYHSVWTQAKGADRGGIARARRVSLARQCARAAEPDGANRHHEPANANRCAAYPSRSRAPRGIRPSARPFRKSSRGARGRRARLYPQKTRRGQRQHDPRGGIGWPGAEPFLSQDESAGDRAQRVEATLPQPCRNSSPPAPYQEGLRRDPAES